MGRFPPLFQPPASPPSLPLSPSLNDQSTSVFKASIRKPQLSHNLLLSLPMQVTHRPGRKGWQASHTRRSKRLHHHSIINVIEQIRQSQAPCPAAAAAGAAAARSKSRTHVTPVLSTQTAAAIPTARRKTATTPRMTEGGVGPVLWDGACWVRLGRWKRTRRRRWRRKGRMTRV